MDLCSYKYGPVAQTGRALPLQGRGPGFKSRWVHLCEGMIFFLIICALVTLLALTNRILVVCYVKLLGR